MQLDGPGILTIRTAIKLQTQQRISGITTCLFRLEDSSLMVYLTFREWLITSFAMLLVSLRYIYEVTESVNSAKIALLAGTLFVIEV